MSVMTHKYSLTLHWYVETDEDLAPGSQEADEKILEILRHRLNGTASCSTCPTRNPDSYTIRRYDTVGEKPVYMSPDKIVE